MPKNDDVKIATELYEKLPEHEKKLAAALINATACAGILRRAERRGKELPPQLKEALISVVNASTQEETAVTEESLQ